MPLTTFFVVGLATLIWGLTGLLCSGLFFAGWWLALLNVVFVLRRDFGIESLDHYRTLQDVAKKVFK